jgi:hypothetical protein
MDGEVLELAAQGLSGESRDSRPAPDRLKKAMCTHPDRIGQLAREHHHQMLAQASLRGAFQEVLR